ncbi:oligosaccharide flippase family protein [Pseudoxanthomonas sp. GW2]|uniref:oligosaccharide flippase family protein n=1 Tax=Pseudoxanthomonas sp. GW2 TaxID=1211114 RepID=UPI0009FDF760|nr:oligosaccharide flippase family protein [Pseudoxanthomonas sp. GW2]
MSSLLNDAFSILFARGFIRVAQLLSFLLLARFLTPQEFGWFGLVTTTIGLAATLGSLGFRQSIAYQVGRNEMTAGEGAATLLVTWPPLALAASLIAITFSPADGAFLSPLSSATAIAVGVGCTMLVMMLQGLLLAGGQIKQFSTTETLPRALLAAFSVGLAALGLATAETAVWAHSLSFALTIPVALSLGGITLPQLRVRIDRLPSLIGYGVGFALNLFLITLCARVSMFIIEPTHGAASAGNFFAAARINDIVLEAATALGLAVFSRSVRNSDTSSVAQKTAKIACGVFWTFTIFAAIPAVLFPLLVPLVIGSGYEESGRLLQVLAIGLGAAAANKIIYPALAGQGKPWFGTAVILISLAVNVILSLVLIPKFGALGGAAALVIGQYTMFAGYIATCVALFSIRAKNFLAPSRQDIRTVVRFIVDRFPGSSK